jgi:hypothetical protein
LAGNRGAVERKGIAPGGFEPTVAGAPLLREAARILVPRVVDGDEGEYVGNSGTGRPAPLDVAREGPGYLNSAIAAIGSKRTRIGISSERRKNHHEKGRKN